MNDSSRTWSDQEVHTGSKVTVDVGTLAVIVIIVVSAGCVLLLLSLYCWFRFSSHSAIRCGRCHQMVGVRNVRLPPEVALQPQYNVVVQPQPQQIYHQQNPQNVGNLQHGTASLVGLPGSRQQHHQYPPQQHQHRGQGCLQNVPDIVVNQPQNIQFGDSATFQRLGLSTASESIVSQDAKALENPSLAMTQISPPESGHHQMEMLTPSPHHVTSVHYTPITHQPSKLLQVRMMDYPLDQSPCTKTPDHVATSKGGKGKLMM